MTSLQSLFRFSWQNSTPAAAYSGESLIFFAGLRQ
jgi:hypothetical protein